MEESIPEADCKCADRARVILSFDEGIPYKTISNCLFLGKGTVANYLEGCSYGLPYKE